jgi:hypothetical protein
MFQHYSHTTDEREIKRLSAKALAGVVPLHAAEVCNMLGLDHVARQGAVAFLDASKRPDLRDLPRVVRSDAPTDGADTHTKWMYLIGAAVPDPTAILEVDFKSPVRCKVKIAFSIERHNAFLWHAAQKGVIHLRIGKPQPVETNFATLATQVVTDDLTAILAQHALVELARMPRRAR